MKRRLWSQTRFTLIVGKCQEATMLNSTVNSCSYSTKWISRKPTSMFYSWAGVDLNLKRKIKSFLSPEQKLEADKRRNWNYVKTSEYLQERHHLVKVIHISVSFKANSFSFPIQQSSIHKTHLVQLKLYIYFHCCTRSCLISLLQPLINTISAHELSYSSKICKTSVNFFPAGNITANIRSE